MAPTDRLVPRFAAEPPQDLLPYGRWADTLQAQFLTACEGIESDDELGEAGELRWFPDRTWHGRTFVPASCRTSTGRELYGYVAFVPARDGGEPETFTAEADYADETAEENPHWKLDLSDFVIGRWRGERGQSASMTLVFGTPLVKGGAIVTAELAKLAVDQCPLVEERFTLIAPDAYRGDELDIRLWDKRGGELAIESLYEEDSESGPADESERA